MPLLVIGVLIFLMKLADFGPVARWSWWWVLSPLALVFIWWEFISPLVGWDKKEAARKMAAAEKEAAETKRKQRGF
ncbi:MAG: TIGR04438 family Trp-rich protein [Betaproteobacteria bacterium]|nr:TIGR04438 family Trp-rich protein [Betaproteobacteria bacterium]